MSDLLTLRGRARLLGGQSPLGAGQIYGADTEVNDHLNSQYTWSWAEIKKVNNGWGKTTTTIDTVADQQDYDLPADFDNRVIQVLVSDNIDFSVTPPSSGNHREVIPSPSYGGFDNDFRRGVFSTPAHTYLFFQDPAKTVSTIRLSGPTSTAQTGGLFIAYESFPPVLPADVDVPLIPPSHHEMLAYMAAKDMRGSRDILWPAELEETRQRLISSFFEDILQMVYDPNFRPPAAGQLVGNYPASTMGYRRRTGRRGARRGRC